MHRIASLALVSAVVAGTGAAAADGQAKSDASRRCTMETVVGSHLPRKVCSTAAERESQQQHQSDQTLHVGHSVPLSQRQGGALR